mgnify:CR=1 FL=1
MKREGKEVDKTYQLFDKFIYQTIVNCKSFLTKENKDLSSQAFEDCYRRYVENTITDSNQSYDEKIEKQFDGAKPEANLVLAHAIWLWAFGVSDKKVKRKKKYTREILEGDFTISGDELYPKGVGSAGQWHSQNKYHEIRFTFLLIRHLRKQLDEGQLDKSDIRKRIEDICLYQKYEIEFEGVNKFSKLVKDLPTNSLAIANILLHFANPDNYEPIASDTHKKQIVSSFSGLLEKELSEDKKLIRDQKIQAIRQAISRFKGEKFTFYDRELKKVWNYSAIQKEFDELEGLEYKKAIILYGPPGTSKTYAARKIGESLITKHFLKNKENVRAFFEGEAKDYLEERITELQLHPSYTYEDFVAGMQLKDDETEPVQGKLFKICENAADDEQGLPHVLILDEINRVDLSHLFGEVFSLLEDRGKKKPVAVGEGEKFKLAIPENLYVIGTMNEIDFSLERIDFALRRRFLWYPYSFDPERLKGIIKEKYDGFNDEELERFVRNAARLNNEISSHDELGKQYEIGHTFFAEIAYIYQSYLKLNSKKYLKNKIYKKGGPAEILWDISIKPIIESFFGSMNPDDVNEKIASLRKTYLQESH